MRAWLLALLSGFGVLWLAACGAPSTPDFVAQAATLNLYAIEAGKIASEKGQSDAVRQFGRHMAEQHEQMDRELKSVVLAEKIEADMPAGLDERQQGMIKALNDSAPADFDRIYANQQLNALKRAVDMFDSYAEAGDNAGLKQFAANMLQAMKQNRDRAKKLPR